MASFDTRIKVFVDAQEAYKELAKVEKNLNKINNLATRSQAKILVDNAKLAAERSEKELANQVKLNAAKERQATLEKAIKRAGVSDDRADEVENLLKVSKAAKDNLVIRNAVNAALEKTLQTQREINRTDAAQNTTASKITTEIRDRIAALRAVGATESEINKIVETRTDLIKQNDRKQTDLARESFRRIDRQLTTLEKKYSQFLNPTTQAASPIRGTSTMPGSPAYLAAQDKAFKKESTAQRQREENFRKLFEEAEKIRNAFRVDKQNLKLRELSYKKLFRDAEKIREAFGPRQNLSLPALPAAGQSSANKMKAIAEARLAKEKQITAEQQKQKAEQDKIVARALERLDTVSSYQRFLRQGNDILDGFKAKEKAVTAEKVKQLSASERAIEAAKKQSRATDQNISKIKQQTRAQKEAADQRKKDRSGRLNAALTGAGFPLLFGGGLGQAIGGGIGGALGGSKLGLGLGIALSAIIGGLEGAARAAGEFAKTATKGATAIDDLIKAFGITGTQSSSALRFADQLGIEGAARQAAQGSLESIVGKDGIKNLEELARSSDDAGNALKRFGAATSAFFAPLITGLNDLIANIFGGVSKLEQAERKEKERASVPIRQRGSAVRRSRLANQITEARQSPEAQAQLKLEEEISKVVADRVEVAERAAELESRRLTTRRDIAAAEKGELNVRTQQIKLDAIRISLAGKLSEEKRRQLELEEKLTEQAVQQAEEARKNAIIEAERQITREVNSLNIQTEQTAQRIYDTEKSIADIQRTQAERYEARTNQIIEEFKTKKAVLEVEKENALLGVIEEEKKRAINELYANRLALIREENNLQGELARLDNLRIERQARLFSDQLRLTQLKERERAAEAVRQTSPQYANSFATQGLGFFGDSAKAETDILARTAAQIEDFNLRIAYAQRELNKAVADKEGTDTIRDLARNLATLQNNRDAFTEAQALIDEAAIAQAKYNDALKFTAPAASLLTNALRDVVSGAATAQEALANIFNGLSDIFLNKANELIAKFAAEGITNLLTDGAKAATDAAADAAQATAEAAAIGTAVGTAVTAGNVPLIASNTALAASVAANTAALTINTAALTVPKLASGGTASAGNLHIVGEEGPELFIPGVTGTVVSADQFEAAKEALAKETNAAFADSSDALSMATATRSANTAAAAEASAMQSAEQYFTSSKSTMDFNTYRVGELDVVTREDAMKIGMESAKQAEANVYRNLRNMPAVRGRTGVK